MSQKFQLVGSLLRPTNLLNYKRQIEHNDTITYPFYNDLEGYENCEVEATKDIIRKQLEHGIDIISDGEFSKSIWHLDFVWGFKGVGRKIAKQGYFFRDKNETTKYDYETRKDIALVFTEKFGGKDHHFIKIFKRILSFADGVQTKLCIPSPSHMFGEFSWSKNIQGKDEVYSSSDDMKSALLKAYKDFTQEYADAGGKILQLDDCLWQIFADDNPNSPFTGQNVDMGAVNALADEFVELNNSLIDFGHNLGLKMWTHNCRGNYESRHMGGGTYSKISDLFLKQQKYDRFFLEWDDERAGGLDALEAFKDKPEAEVVLGLMSSKTNTLDDEDRIVKLLNEASKIIDKNRLFLSHQCGFASCDGGNELTEEEQWAKIKQGQKIALQYWGI
ncbi:MAG: cobalamin-independent methionine synthase II family protein [Defluviitaleaceae bacterium]|nr:cobalamin-independent methionine synthase II family protein [Defluviitaleaceae bacterium]